MAPRNSNVARNNEVDRVRTAMREMQARGAFGGPGVEDDLMPADALLEEVRRTAGIVRWVEMKMAEKWDADLLELGEEVHGVNGVQYIPTNESGWLKIYQIERAHLARICKLALDAGVAERQVRIAEGSAELMYQIITSAIKQLGLTEDQQNRVPEIMATVLTRAATETRGIE